MEVTEWNAQPALLQSLSDEEACLDETRRVLENELAVLQREELMIRHRIQQLGPAGVVGPGDTIGRAGAGRRNGQGARSSSSFTSISPENIKNYSDKPNLKRAQGERVKNGNEDLHKALWDELFPDEGQGGREDEDRPRDRPEEGGTSGSRRNGVRDNPSLERNERSRGIGKEFDDLFKISASAPSSSSSSSSPSTSSTNSAPKRDRSSSFSMLKRRLWKELYGEQDNDDGDDHGREDSIHRV